MSTGMIEIMKLAAREVIENDKPCDLRFGTVSSISPLSVRISSDLILPESVLVVPQYLTDYTVNVNIGLSDGETSPGGSGSGGSLTVTDDGMGNVVISGMSTTEVETIDETEEVDEFTTEGVDERTLTIYNALEVGDNVVLLRNQGGKSYLILDRV